MREDSEQTPDAARAGRSPRHWRSLEERDETSSARLAARNEFQSGAMDYGDPPPPGRLSRREFFGVVGATASLAAAVACDRTGKSAMVPYTRKPVEIVPGVANYYASTFTEGRRSYAVLVKTREGRPIHLAGNDEHPGLRGKTTPRALAAVQGLYDPERLRSPRNHGRPVSWDTSLRELTAALAAARTSGKRVLLLTGALASPTGQALVTELKAALPVLDHLAWEPAVCASAERGARLAFGTPVQVRPRLEGADVILSLGADFLDGDDPEAVAAFTARRRPAEPVPTMSRLWVLEGPLSLTGSNADQRFPVRPSRIAGLALALAKDLHDRHGRRLPAGVDLAEVPSGVADEAGLPPKAWRRLLLDLHRAGPKAVVLCGGPMPAEAHIAAHLLNAMLGSQGVELREAEPLGSNEDLAMAARAMAAGDYGAVILWGVNPAFAFPDPAAWAAAFGQVPIRVWMGRVEDESSAQCGLLLAEHHWLEAWGDAADGSILTLRQPAVGALYDTRQGEDVLLSLLKGLGGAPAVSPGTASEDYHAYLKSRWRREVQAPGSPVPFERFFQAALHDGLVRVEPGRWKTPPFRGEAVAGALEPAFRMAKERAMNPVATSFELVLRPCTQLHDGRYAHSGWLQELPDPVTKATWGNPLAVSVADGKRLGLRDGDLVQLEVAGRKVKLPIILQPGQAAGVLAVAFGHGRSTGTNRGHGTNVFPLLALDPAWSNLRAGVGIERGQGRAEIAFTQNHHRMDGRDLVHSFTLLDFVKAAQRRRASPAPRSLYPDQTFDEHKWGMVIDLAACVGCTACIVACQSENNIPTVGAEQVAKGREMHWIRIDRYYEGSEDDPKVVHQPMLCQHCDDAPCENVCPVNATNHSPDGLNQMVYNRCVGTRYCANNCPYKVRRFNFLEYTADQTEPADLQYNPEVTVRPRGVMEKCSFCVQRIQDGRMRALLEGRPIRDGEITPACAAACPGSAIVFGDLKDSRSQVSGLASGVRGYKVLEELGTRPAITYLADLKNPALEGDQDGA